jgi:D-threo-aldose 1-dehydrogenase
VDIVYVHDPDDHVDQAIAEAVPALIECRDQGLLSAIGVGTNSWRAPLRLVRETPIDVVMLAGATFDYGPAGSELIAAAHRLADTCERHGVTLPAAALQFPLRRRCVAAVVAGTSTATEVVDAINRLSAAVPEALWRELEESGLRSARATAAGESAGGGRCGGPPTPR